MAEPQEDSVAIAQSGINPITGSPLSSEQRKALFRRTVAPSSILGQSGSLVGRNDDSSSIVVAQTQQITSLQDQLNVIRAQVSVLDKKLESNITPVSSPDSSLVVAQTQQINPLQDQLNVIRSQVSVLDNKLESNITPDSSLVVAQTQQITSLQDQLNVIRAEISVLGGNIQSSTNSNIEQSGSLVKRIDDTSSSLVVAQTKQITPLQEQIDVIRAQVFVINTGLANINNIIQKDGILEQQRLREEQETERRNAELQVRTGQENELERKIQSALMAPVAALQKKVSNIFGNIFGALTTLFMGWLTNQGIEALKAYEEGNKEKLEQIKDTVLKNILYAVGAVAAIKIGFNVIIRSVIGLAAKIGATATRLALAPFRFLGNKLAKVPGALGGLFGGGGAKKPPGARNPTSKISNVLNGIGSKVKGATSAAVRGIGGPIVQGTIGTLLDISMGEDPSRAIAGAASGVAGATLAGAAASPLGPIASFAAGATGYGLASGFGKEQYDKFMGKEETSPESPAASQTQAAQPQASMMPQPSSPATQAPSPAAAPKISSSPETLTSPIETSQAPPPAAQPQEPMVPQLSDLTITQPTSPAAQPQASMMLQPSSPATQPTSPATSTVPPPSAEMVKNFEMAWKYKDNSMFRGRIESAWEKMTPEQKIQAKNWADSTGKNWDEMKLSAPPVSPTSTQSLPTSSLQQQMSVDTKKAYTIPSLISADQMQTVPTQSPNIGSLPEPQPNVVMLPSQQSQKSQSMIAPSSAGSDTPLINSANPDNFYVLYSQLNYNVVM